MLSAFFRISSTIPSKFCNNYYVCILKFESMSTKASFLFLLIFALTHTMVSGQRIKGQIIAGMNLSQVDGDEIYGFDKVGMNMGVGAMVPLGKNFSFSLETLFSQKGSYQGNQYEDVVVDTATGQVIATYNGMYKLKMDYVEVPFLIQYTDKEIITAGVGFSYGRLVNIKEYEHDTLNVFTTLNSGVYDRNDYNVLVDLQMRIHRKIPRWKFNVRYAYSISKIRTRDFYTVPPPGQLYVTRDQYNNLFSIRLIYVFNEKPPLARQKK